MASAGSHQLWGRVAPVVDERADSFPRGGERATGQGLKLRSHFLQDLHTSSAAGAHSAGIRVHAARTEEDATLFSLGLPAVSRSRPLSHTTPPLDGPARPPLQTNVGLLDIGFLTLGLVRDKIFHGLDLTRTHLSRAETERAEADGNQLLVVV
jgi:hypothetical protein